MLISLATVIAGLGMFFAGIWFLSENLKRATSRRFRRGVMKWTRVPVMGFGVGVIAGALTQSMAVTVFILVGMLRAGLIGVKNALPLIAGANNGLSVLVFVATLETQLVMLFVIGIVGVLIGLDVMARFRPLVGALFGLSMLFLGIDLIQTGAVPLIEHDWAEGLLTLARQSFMAGFLAGAILTCVTQSSAAVAILAIALADAGVFGLEQTIMIIYGTNFGSAMFTAALSWNLRGRSLQIALFQIFFNVLGCAIVVPLFYLEVYGGVPFMKSLVVWLSPLIDVQLAWVYLLFSAPPSILLMVTLNPGARLLDRLCPPTAVEDLSKPRYVYDRATKDPELAMDLALLELRREVESLPAFLTGLEPGASSGRGLLEDRHAAFTMLANRVLEFIDGIGRKVTGTENFDKLKELYSHQRLINSTEATIYELVSEIHSIEGRSPLRPLAAEIVQALNGLVGQNIAAAFGRTPASRETNVTLDSPSATLLEEMRQIVVGHDQDLSKAERAKLFRIANLAERVIWLLSHLPLHEFAHLNEAEG